MNKQIKEEIELTKSIKEKLANYLGVEPDDINDDDSLTTDLHMKPSDLTDFAETLDGMGIETANLDFTEIDSFSDLLEQLDVV